MQAISGRPQTTRCHTDPKMTILYSRPTIDDVEKNFTSPMKAIDE